VKKKPKLLPFVVEIRSAVVTSHCVWAASLASVLEITPDSILTNSTGHVQHQEVSFANIKPWPKGLSRKWKA